MWRWSTARPLPRRVREQLATAMIDRSLSAARGTTGGRGVLSRARRLAVTVARAPALLGHPTIWWRVIRARVRILLA